MKLCHLLLGYAALALSLVSTPSSAHHHDQFQMECTSSQYRLTYCNTGHSVDHVDLLQQQSSAPCVYGQSWGYDQANIWVDRGCRALFLVTAREEPPYVDIDCGSHNYQYNACDTFMNVENVQLIRQESSAACRPGQSWGFDRRFVWVDRGCRALFRVYGWQNLDGE